MSAAAPSSFLRPYQRGDAEVQQLHLAFCRHQNVRWFDIPVHDEMAVRVRYRRNDIHEQGDALPGAQLLRCAVLIDALALDVLEHQIRLAARRNAGVE